MNRQQFDICLSFHLGLIRSRPHQKTIDEARDGVDSYGARKLTDALNDRMVSLSEWLCIDFTKESIYNRCNTRNPSPGAFTAAFSVINDGAKISKAAIANKVNYQSVKVLIPRLQRWEEYAQKWAKTL